MKRKQRTSSRKNDQTSQQDTPTVDVSSHRVIGPVKFRFQKRGVSTFTLSHSVTITVTLGKLEIRSEENEFPPFSLKTTDFVKPPKALTHRIKSWLILDCVQDAEYSYICIQVDETGIAEVVDTLMLAWSNNKTSDSDAPNLFVKEDNQIMVPIHKPPVLSPEPGSSWSNMLGQEETTKGGNTSARVIESVHVRYLKKGSRSFIFSRFSTITATAGKITFSAQDNKFSPFSLKTYEIVKAPKAPKGESLYWLVLDCIQYANAKFLCINIQAEPDRMNDLAETLLFAWSSNKSNDPNSSGYSDVLGDSDPFTIPVHKPPALLQKYGSGTGCELIQQATSIGGSYYIKVIDSVPVMFLKKGTLVPTTPHPATVNVAPGKITVVAHDKKFPTIVLKTSDLVSKPKAPTGKITTWLLLDCVQHVHSKYEYIKFQAGRSKMADVIDILLFAWKGMGNDPISSDVFDDPNLPFITAHKPPALLREPGTGSGSKLIQQATSIGESPSVRVIESVPVMFKKKGTTATSSSRLATVTVTPGKITIVAHDNKFPTIVLKTSDVANKPKEPKGPTSSWLILDCVQHPLAEYTYINLQAGRSRMAEVIDILMFAWPRNKSNVANYSGHPDVFENSGLSITPVQKPPALLQEPGSASGGELIQEATSIGGSPSIRVIDSVLITFLKKGSAMPTTLLPATVTVTPGQLSFLSVDDNFVSFTLKTTDLVDHPKAPVDKRSSWLALDCAQYVRAKYTYVNIKVDTTRMADVVDILNLAWSKDWTSDPNSTALIGDIDLQSVHNASLPYGSGKLIHPTTSIEDSNTSVRVMESVMVRFLRKDSSMPRTPRPATVTVTPGKISVIAHEHKFMPFTLETWEFVNPPTAPTNKNSTWLTLDCINNVAAKFHYISFKVDANRMGELMGTLKFAWSSNKSIDPDPSDVFGNPDLSIIHKPPALLHERGSGSCGELTQQSTSIGGRPSVRVIDSVYVKYLKLGDYTPTTPRPATVTVTTGKITIVAQDNKFPTIVLKTSEVVSKPKEPKGKITNWLALDCVQYVKAKYIYINFQTDRMSELVETLLFAWSSNKIYDLNSSDLFADNADEMNVPFHKPPPNRPVPSSVGVGRQANISLSDGIDELGKIINSGQSNQQVALTSQKSIYSVILRYVMKDSIRTPKRACTSITTITVTPGKLEFRSTDNKYPTFTLNTSDFVGPPQAPSLKASLKTPYAPPEVVLDCIQHDRVNYQYLAIQVHAARTAEVINTLMFAWTNEGICSSDKSDDAKEGIDCPLSSLKNENSSNHSDGFDQTLEDASGNEAIRNPAQKTTTLRDILENFGFVDEEVKPAPVHKKLQPNQKESTGLFDDYGIDGEQEVKPETVHMAVSKQTKTAPPAPSRRMQALFEEYDIDGKQEVKPEAVHKSKGLNKLAQEPAATSKLKKIAPSSPLTRQMQGLFEDYGIDGKQEVKPVTVHKSTGLDKWLQGSAAKQPLKKRTAITPGIGETRKKSSIEYDFEDDSDTNVFPSPQKKLTSLSASNTFDKAFKKPHNAFESSIFNGLGNSNANTGCGPPVAKKAKLSDGMEAEKEYKEIEKEFILLAEKVFRLEDKSRKDVVNLVKEIVEDAVKSEK